METLDGFIFLISDFHENSEFQEEFQAEFLEQLAIAYFSLFGTAINWRMRKEFCPHFMIMSLLQILMAFF